MEYGKRCCLYPTLSGFFHKKIKTPEQVTNCVAARSSLLGTVGVGHNAAMDVLLPDMTPLLLLQTQLYSDYNFRQIDGIIEGKASSHATEMMKKCQGYFMQLQNHELGVEERQAMMTNNMVCLHKGFAISLRASYVHICSVISET